MRPPLTTADAALAEIRRAVADRGYPPSLSELAEALGCSKGSAKNRLDELVKAGKIRRAPGEARGIVLVDELAS
jgi:repressor LexA